MTQWILIIAVLTYGSNGGNTVATAEFADQLSCVHAMEKVSEFKQYAYEGLQYKCVPKKWEPME